MYFRTPFHLPDDGVINQYYSRAHANHSDLSDCPSMAFDPPTEM